MSRGVPRFEAGLLPVIMPGVVRLVRAALMITPESAARSIERVRGVFKDVGDRLNDGRRFMVGDRFTAADLTFAALAAPVLFPAGYRAAYPALEDVPAAMRDEVLRLRDTDAGRFALRMFSQERTRSPAGAQGRHSAQECLAPQASSLAPWPPMRASSPELRTTVPRAAGSVTRSARATAAASTGR